MTSRYEFIVGPSRFIPPGLPTSPLPPRRRPAGASGDAVLRWGRPSDFQFASTAVRRVFVTQPAYDTLPEDDDIAEVELLFTETARVTTTVRIENPSDSSQFVDVEVIDRISFVGPDGVVRTFVLSN